MQFETKNNYGISDLLDIMALLRSENGCPWDKEQTHQSIRKNVIEEAYEVAEAIDYNNPDMIREELGDLLLQVVFHCQMGNEAKNFSFDDVCDEVCKKLIIRHPHIFSDAVADSSAQVLNTWEEIKKQQKGQKTATETIRSVPAVFPALMRSQKIQKRAAKSGFDYPSVLMAIEDLESEIKELKAAIKNDDTTNCIEEIGDVVFSAVNVSRLIDVDAEEALTFSCNKFVDRFEEVEKLATREHVDMKTASLEKLNMLWQMAKAIQREKTK